MGDCKVSVVVPAYNNADYTVETVASVLAQTYGNREIIVVDDGSTDHTRDALKKFGDEIRYVYKENGGACSARNLGIGMSTGVYVACLDCDDLWLPEKLAYSVAALDANPQAGFVFTGCYLIDGTGCSIGQVQNLCDSAGDAFRGMLAGGAVPAPSVVMRRKCLEEVGLFDEKIFIPADLDLWLRLARRYPVCRVDAPLSKYRMDSNYTLKNIRLSLDEHLYVLDKLSTEEGGVPPGLEEKVRRRFLYMHAMMYRKIDDVDHARQTLKRALEECPFSWSIFANYAMSLVGLRAWNWVAWLRGTLVGNRRGTSGDV